MLSLNLGGLGASKRVGPYVMTSKYLGSGAKGKVREGYHERTKERVAVKIIYHHSRETGRPHHEYELMQICRHPNVVKVFTGEKTSKKCIIVMELMSGGTLMDYVKWKGRLEISETLKLFRQIVSAVYFIHSLHISHRDIKLENILLDANKTITKITDFGFASMFEDEMNLGDRCGTHCYMSPEMICREYSGPKADVWSLGVSLFVMVTGRFPFDDTNSKKLTVKIKSGQMTIPAFVHNETLRDLISNMLIVDYKQRFSLDDVINHSWFKEAPIDNSCTIQLQRPDPIYDELNGDILTEIVELGIREKDTEALANIIRSEGTHYYKAIYRLVNERKNDQQLTDLLLTERERKSKTKDGKLSTRMLKSSRSNPLPNLPATLPEVSDRGLAESERLFSLMESLMGPPGKSVQGDLRMTRERSITMPLPKLPSNPAMLDQLRMM